VPVLRGRGQEKIVKVRESLREGFLPLNHVLLA
jgi:hypothetical protein